MFKYSQTQATPNYYDKSSFLPALTDWGSPVPTGDAANAMTASFNNAMSNYLNPPSTATGFGGVGSDNAVSGFGAAVPGFGSNAAGSGIFGGLFSGIGDALKSSGFLGSTDANNVKTDGWGGAAIGLANGIGNAYMGMKQYGLAKDQYETAKSQFNQQYAALPHKKA